MTLITPLQLIEIAHIVRHTPIVDYAPITELLYDSRKVTSQNGLFFALVTEQNDGHKYIETLYNKGIRNFVISRHIDDFKHIDGQFFQVSNVLQTLQTVAAFHRQKFQIPTIAITGSNGKTIVKEWLAALMASKYSVIKSPNSFNSQIGVPISVSHTHDEHQIAIFEAGISKPGEMEKLAAVIAPTLGIITNIGDAHAAFFSSQKEKLVEKLKLFVNAKVLIYSSEHALITEILQDENYQHLAKISWGHSPNDDYYIEKTTVVNHATYFHFRNISTPIMLPFTDDASIENALHVVTLALYMDFLPEEINAAVAHLSPINMRMEIVEAQHHSIIVNDTYSLDKNSLRIALQYLNTQIQLPNKTVIISDFAQNLKTDTFYPSLLTLFQEHNVRTLITVGAAWGEKITDYPNGTFYHFDTTEALLQNIHTLSLQNEAILAKGARAFQFEKIVHALKLKKHRTVLQVNLSALIQNLNYYKSKIDPKTKIMGMVKAMSYGLGDAELINELCYHQIDYLAVAYVDEGVALRERNITTPIVVLGAEADGFETMIRYQLEPEIFNLHYLQQFGELVAYHPEIERYPIHIKLETGMHRLGFNEEEIAPMLNMLAQYPKLHVTSIFSHLAAADMEQEDHFTQTQIALFEQRASQIAQRLPYPVLLHLVNSAGITRFPEAHYNMVRLGIGLYGFSNVKYDQKQLQHAVTLKSIITQVKHIHKGDTIGYDRSFKATHEMKIAIVPIGYADGYPRELSNGIGEMIVKGVRCPIVGKVCMDMTMIDISKVDAKEDDEVIMYGEDNPIQVIAKKIGKIPYELITAISKRVQRVYIRE